MSGIIELDPITVYANATGAPASTWGSVGSPGYQAAIGAAIVYSENPAFTLEVFEFLEDNHSLAPSTLKHYAAADLWLANRSDDQSLYVAYRNTREANFEAGSGTFSGGTATPFAALAHYMFGNGTDMDININDIGLKMSANEIPSLKDAIANFKTPGKYQLSDAKFAYSTSSDSAIAGSYLGNVSLKNSGEFIRHSDGSWSYTGSVRGFSDIYDANPSNHRGPIAEASTWALSLFQGTPYDININGTLSVKLSGK
jgi:hypothetical protein